MATKTVIKQDPSEWTGDYTQENEVEGSGASNDTSYIAMQPVEDGEVHMEGQIEETVEVQDCQEVVLVAEGSEVVEDIAETIQLGETQMVPVGAEEVYGEAFIVPNIKEEKAEALKPIKISSLANRHSIPSKLQMQLDAASTPQSSWSSVDFSRPSFTSPDKYYKSLGYYRPGGGKSLTKMRKLEEQRDSSDAESDGDTPYLPSTMLRHKTPKRREFAHRLQWRNRDMLEAMKAVEEQKQTIRGAAKKYNVPYSTLKDRVHGRVRHGAKPGVKTILSPEEEEELAKFVRDMENAGFQLRCVDVRDRAAELLRLNHGHNSPYKDGSPGHNWFHGFVKRHPGLEFKRTVKRNIVPSITKQKHMLRRFYDITACIYKKNKLSHKSDRIYAVSELRIGGQFEATILYASSANGSLIPPFVIFRGSALKLNSARQEYPDAFFTCSYDGRVNEDIFLWWFRDHFLKKVPTGPSRPGICFISRGVHDITMQLTQLAKEEKMNLVGMTFGISHLVQPLDDDVSDMIRNAFNKRFKRWQDENPGLAVTQKVVAAVLRKVWNKVNPEDIATKFTANGIYPLNAYAITQDKLLTGAHILREMVERSPPRHEPPPPPLRQPNTSSGLSGLNLLSALSSQEYASLDPLNSSNQSYQGNHSFETQSDVSVNEGLYNNMEPTPGYKIMFQNNPGKENEVVVVPLNETSESGVVEQVEVESSEPLETEVVHEEVPVLNEQLVELMQKQRELTASSRQPPRGIELLQRNVDVRSELSASRENAQISKAVDSILGDVHPGIKNEPRSPSTRSASPCEEPDMDSVTSPSTSRSSRGQSQGDDNTTVIRIAPDKIKDEISKAIQSGSFSKTNTLKLSDFHGNDIKIQIRIKNPDELKELSSASSASQSQSSSSAGISSNQSTPGRSVPRIISQRPSMGGTPSPRTNISTPSPSFSSSPASSSGTRYIITSPRVGGTGGGGQGQIKTIRLQGGQVQGQTIKSQGRFIQVSAPVGSSSESSGAATNGTPQNVTMNFQSTPPQQLRSPKIVTTTVAPKIEFKPTIMKVEKVQESLPSQFFEDDELEQQSNQSSSAMEVEETVVTSQEHEELVEEEQVSEDGVITTEEIVMSQEDNIVTLPHEVMTSSTTITTTSVANGSGDATGARQQIKMADDGSIQLVMSGGDGDQLATTEDGQTEEQEVTEECTMEYINEQGEVIQVQEIQQQ